MPAGKIGLYIGKFQPFHNGHLFAITTISPNVSKLIIVIGSSQYHNLKSQPFSAQERRQMIEHTLAAESINNFSIAEVPDVHDNDNWVEHVRHYVPQFDIVFTNNELVRQLFAEKGFEVKAIRLLPGVSGTLVRQKLGTKASDWQSLVPGATASIIKSSISAS